MKTVMKKMFSLLLVAVLLVGMLPFQASADGLVTIKVTLNGNDCGSITKDHATAGGAPLSSWIEDAKASLPENARTYATCSGLIGESGNPVDPDAVVNGWTIFANFTLYCSSCGQYDHATAETHCACGYYKGHRDSCTAGCKNTYGCDWGFAHLSTCTYDKCAVCNQAKHDGSCCSECKALNGEHTDACKSGCTNDYDCTWNKTHETGCKYQLCETCGKAKHGNIACCAECKNSTGGHETSCTSGCTKKGDCTWAYTHNTGCLSQHKCTVCEQFGHLEEDCPSTRCDKCEGTVTNHTRSCPTLENTGKVKVYLNLNYGNAYEYGEEIEYVWADKNELLQDVVADLVEPRREGHHFQYWTTREGTVIDRYNTVDRATADGVVIFAQWVDIIQSDSGTIDVTVDLNYGGHKEYINNIISGVEMGNVLEYAGTPVRLYYKFLGWYWDKDCTDAVEYNEKIYKDRTIYAKWDYRYTNNEILLKVYLNGNTHTTIRTIDMYKYITDDGWVSMPEAKEAVKQYYTGKSSTEGLYFEGLYTPEEWVKYVDNKKTAEAENSIEMEREPGHDTIIYVMVNNAKARTYTSSTTTSSTTYKADSSNPKTGDAIYTPVIVMGASVTALAVLFYLNKKRAF